MVPMPESGAYAVSVHFFTRVAAALRLVHTATNRICHSLDLANVLHAMATLIEEFGGIGGAGPGDQA
jgi:hypothetical protein